MKTPPGHREAPSVRVVAAVEGERDRRFLIFGGVVLVAIALGFKSEIWAENQVWVLGLGLIVVAAPVLLGYLRSAGEPPAVEHYIPVALGAITLAGLASSPVFNLQLLQFAWYINRGLVRHTVEDSFTRNVVFEYVAFAAVLIYLFVSNYQAGR